MDYPHLWSRLYGAPLAIHPDKAAVIEAVFRAHVMGASVPAPAEALAAAAARPSVDSASQIRFRERGDRPFALTESGIAVVPILGTLVQRTSGLDALSGMMSYGSIGRRVSAAAEDREARAILLEVDSYGGEAYGLAELADMIVAAGEAKPMWAAINEQAYSAAYSLVAAAKRITIPVSGATGSIGVIALHVDQSKRDATQGYNYTYVYAGAHKKDFNPHEPLSDEAHAILQVEVDRHYGLFTAHVARSRGIPEAAVRATEAGLLSPEVAEAGGFVDDIATFAETIGMIEDALRPGYYSSTGMRTAARRPSTSEKESNMKQYTQAELDAAVAQAVADTTTKVTAEVTASVTASVTETVTARVTAARDARIKAILGCDEAKGRGKLAAHLAFETHTEAEAAKKVLSASAAESAAPSNALDTVMRSLANPAVGTDPDDDIKAAAGKPKIDTRAIYTMWNKPQAVAKTH